MSLATILWLASLTASCRLDTQNTDMTTVKTDGGYQSSFEELPGYFVELMVKVQDNNATTASDQAPSARIDGKTSIEDYEGMCSGTHIGSGFILTAAHCITEFVCGDLKMHELNRIGLKYNRKIREAASFSNSSVIKAVVFHHDYYKLQAGYPTPVPQLRHDLALIKTSGLDFADAARLPEPSQHHLSAAQLSGKSLLVYGIGSSYAAQLMRQQLNALGLDYFWGEVTATNLSR